MSKVRAERVMVSRQVCNTCGEDKPADAYWKQAKKITGLFGECKACARRRNTGWCRANAEVMREEINCRSKRARLKNPMRSLVNGARHRAKIMGLEFSITAADVPMPDTCPVLGIPLLSGMGAGKPKWFRDDSPSIDRIDNAKGYVPGNVVVISFRANRLKSNASIDELAAIVRFYRELEGERAREGAPGGTDAAIRRLPAVVSEVLATAQEEKGPVPARDCAWAGDQGVLPPLRMGNGVR